MASSILNGGRLQTYWLPDANGLKLWRRCIPINGNTALSATYPQFDAFCVDAQDNIWVMSGNELCKIVDGCTTNKIDISGVGWDIPGYNTTVMRLNIDGSIWIARGRRVVRFKDGVIQESWLLSVSSYGGVTDMNCAMNLNYPNMVITCGSLSGIAVFSLSAGSSSTTPCPDPVYAHSVTLGTLPGPGRSGPLVNVSPLTGNILWVFIISGS